MVRITSIDLRMSGVRGRCEEVAIDSEMVNDGS
jgi:hypothetical protein